MNAYEELLNHLNENEKVETIIFGSFGWGGIPDKNEGWEMGYGEDLLNKPIPFELRGKILSLEEAKEYMQCWSFDGGYGSPDCYSVYVWTNQRVFFVSEYDGSTCLMNVPRNPIECFPQMAGG